MGGPVETAPAPEKVSRTGPDGKGLYRLHPFSQIILVAPVGEVELCRDVLKPYCRMDLLHLVEGELSGRIRF